MNMTYNNEFIAKSYPMRRRAIVKKTFADKIIDLLSYIYMIVAAIISSEVFAFVSKMTVFACSFIGLISVAYHVEIGALSFFPAFCIAVLLLGVVAFAFKKRH